MEEPDPNFDLLSSLNLRCFTFALHQLLPAARLEEEMKHTESKLTNSPNAAYFKQMLFSGSMAEGLSVPLVARKDDVQVQEIVEADVDLMMEVNLGLVVGPQEVPRRQDLVLEARPDLPGYVRLEVVDPAMWRPQDMVTLEGRHYLSSVIWKQGVLDSQLKENAAREKPATSVISGPAVKTNTREVTGVMRHLDQEWDLVLCLRVLQWPAEAREWEVRPRPCGWPPTQVRTALVTAGCHLVCLGHPQDARPDVLFRLSFSQAEKTLALGLTPTQRQAYVMLKMLRIKTFREPKVLSSYYLKNVLFWTCEQVGADLWTPDQLGTCLLLLLDKLLFFLSNHNIPHYFVRTNNLIRYVPRDHVNEVCRKVAAARKAPLRHLLQFNKELKFNWGPFYTHLETVLEPVQEAAGYAHVPPDLHRLLEARARRRLAQAFLEETVEVEIEVFNTNMTGPESDLCHQSVNKRYDMAVEVLSENCRLQRASGGHRRPLEHFLLDFLDDLNSYAVLTSFLIYLLKRFEYSDYVPLFYNYLACVYHRVMYKENDEKEKKELRKNAYMSYRRALEHPKCTSWVYVEFAHFLCQTKQYGEAIGHLQKALEKGVSNRENRHNLKYKEHHSNIVCDDIQYVLKYRPEFVVTSSVLAYFLLVKCHLIGGEAVHVKHVMYRFRLECGALEGDEGVDPGVKANAFYLMASACYQDRRWATGVKNADRALGHVADHVGARWMKHWCTRRKTEDSDGQNSSVTEGRPG